MLNRWINEIEVLPRLLKLSITTARTGLADKALEIYPNTGGVLKSNLE